MKNITDALIQKYKEYLCTEEKSEATIEKYIRDITAFKKWLAEQILNKQKVLDYKNYLIQNYAPASVNSVISSMNSFFEFCNWYEMRIKTIKIQKQIFAKAERELTKAEYTRLLIAAQSKKQNRLHLLLQTICSTGIRISELKFITVESLKNETAEISCKGKLRYVFLPRSLCKALAKYAKQQKIRSGSIFVSRNGNPLDRSNVWSEMKKLCDVAGVSRNKVFPHNLRHLFAKVYYSVQKDIVRLADILGHSSINTTRIYTKESGEIHRVQIQKLGLLRC